MKIVLALIAITIGTIKGIFGFGNKEPETHEELLEKKIQRIHNRVEEYELVYDNAIDAFEDALIEMGVAPRDAQTWAISVHEQTDLLRNIREQAEIAIQDLTHNLPKD